MNETSRGILKSLIIAALCPAYIVAIMIVAMLSSGGEGSGEAMLGGLFGIFTCPIVMVSTWFLFKHRTFRVILYSFLAVSYAVILFCLASFAWGYMQRQFTSDVAMTKSVTTGVW